MMELVMKGGKKDMWKCLGGGRIFKMLLTG